MSNMKYKIEVSYTEDGSFGAYPYIVLDSEVEAQRAVSRLKLYCQEHEQRFRYVPINEEESDEFILHLFNWYNQLG